MRELTLIDILRIIKRRKLIVLIIVIVSILLGIGSFFMQNGSEYGYAATIYTKGDYLDSKTETDEFKNEDTVIKELQIGEQLTKDYMSFLDSSYVLKNMQLKLREKYPEFKDYTYNQMNSYIKAKTVIMAKGDNSRFLEVTAKDKNPELAKDIVTFAADELKKSAVEVLGAGSVTILNISLISETNKAFMKSCIVVLITLLISVFLVFLYELLNGSVYGYEQIEYESGYRLIGDIPEY